MNEERLENLIRDVLERKAPVSPRVMPAGTGLRVRGRQGMTALLALGLTIALVLASIELVSTLRRPVARPADRQTEHPPTVGVLPSPQATAPLNDATEPSSSGSTSEDDTSAVSVYSWEPYTDQVEGQEAYLVTQKHVVAYGHIKGLEWSLAAYQTRAYTGSLANDFKGGPCGDLFIGDMGDYGGMTFCLHTNETPSDAQFAMAGFGNGYVPEGFDPAIGPPISGYAGIVGDTVDRVELRLSNGESQDLTLHPGPPGVDARYFVVFVDDGAGGSIVAIGPDGSALAQAGLCLGPVPHTPDNLGCGKGLNGVGSVVTTEP
jgi:hypothetical protein